MEESKQSRLFDKTELKGLYASGGSRSGLNKLPSFESSHESSNISRMGKQGRQRNRHKPYDPVDEINLHRLSISNKSTCQLKQSDKRQPLNVSTKSSSTEQILIQPAKLSLLAKSSHSLIKERKGKSQDSFDFASLAAQVSNLEHNSVKHGGHTFKRWDTRNFQTESFTKLCCEAGQSGDCEECDGLSGLNTNFKLTLSAAKVDSAATGGSAGLVRSCSREAMLNETDFTADELAFYFEELVYIPKKMSKMAEMMYT